MYTRKDYLDHKCTHREYYAQFVTEYTINTVVSTFGIKRLQAALAKDEYLNTIALERWDMVGYAINSYMLDKKLREAGDYPTLAGLVCIVKEAARQAIEQEES